MTVKPFELIVAEHGPTVLRVCRAVLDPADADDAWSETFLAAGIPAEPDSRLWDAVRALPPKQRGAVAYHYLADLPYQEVGKLLGTSEAAARRSAADGIAALRNIYQQEKAR